MRPYPYFQISLCLALALAGCGNDTDQLEPDVDNGAPTHEQLNPPVPPSRNSSMAPAEPANDGQVIDMPPAQREDAVTIP